MVTLLVAQLFLGASPLLTSHAQTVERNSHSAVESCSDALQEAQRALRNGFSNPCGIAPAEAFCPGSHRRIINPYSTFFGRTDSEEMMTSTASRIQRDAHSLSCKIYLLMKAERAAGLAAQNLGASLGGMIPESFTALSTQVRTQLDALRTCRTAENTASHGSLSDPGLGLLGVNGIGLSDAMLAEIPAPSAGTPEAVENLARQRATAQYCAMTRRALYPNGFPQAQTQAQAPSPLTASPGSENTPPAPTPSSPTERLSGELSITGTPTSSPQNSAFSRCENFESRANASLPAASARLDRQALRSRLRFSDSQSALVLYARDQAVVQWIELGEPTSATVVPAEDISWLRQELETLRTESRVDIRSACMDRSYGPNTCGLQEASRRVAPQLLPGVQCPNCR
jgi:hypothetical protein